MEFLLSTLHLAICSYGLYECFHRLTLVNQETVPWKIRFHLYLQSLAFLGGVFYPMLSPLDPSFTFTLLVVAAHLWSTEAFWRTCVPYHLQSGSFRRTSTYTGIERRRSS